MEKRTQPDWSVPVPLNKCVLPEIKLYNSLSSQKERFYPESDTHVRWYTCGPTVYDVSHMGHARTYLAFDILRRIFKDYFLFNVTYVLNITDIDDKIIKRARQTHLIERYMKTEVNLVNLYDNISKAIRNLKTKSATDPDPEKREYLKKESERLIELLGSVPPEDEDSVSFLLKGARDALSDVLDEQHGASITDHKIFEATARRFEEEYHSDMKALNILPPDVLVRVTENIDSIIDFVQKIIDNGFGYSTPSGSVYFDTNRFANDPRHFYAKLVPTAFGDQDQLATGEGELTTSEEKLSSNDFALWKCSKRGEPAWPSPWGPGRPGWHIECSAMASKVFGNSMEIHGGGVDLKFPHHDNELAQSEAYFGHSHWVRYFLHAGHLTISGCKMSKSLKNFVSIRDALKQHSPRRLRLMFLLHSWRDTMDYSPDTLAEAISYEKMLVDFLYNVTSLQLLAHEEASSCVTFTSERPLISLLMKTQHEVYDAFCDSCDTRRALAALKEFIGLADQYALVQVDPDMPLLERADQVYIAASFVLRLLRILGAADLTLASQGSPVPSDAIVAGGAHPPETLLIRTDTSVRVDPAGILSRSWISLDAPTVDRISTGLYAAFKAARTFADVLISEGDAFAGIAQCSSLDIKKNFGVDIFNLPVHEQDCLELVIRTVANSGVVDLVGHQFGLETQIWPIIFRLLFRIVSMRQSARREALNGSYADKAMKQRIMAACDRMRDEDLSSAGIRLQDRSSFGQPVQRINQTPFLGLVDPAILAHEWATKTKRETGKGDPKKNADTKTQSNGCASPSQMFMGQRDKYSAFDQKGMPTHDVSGKELSKTQLKKIQKLYDVQSKRYQAYLKKVNC